MSEAPLYNPVNVRAVPFGRALLTETNVESGDVSKQKWNLCQL